MEWRYYVNIFSEFIVQNVQNVWWCYGLMRELAYKW